MPKAKSTGARELKEGLILTTDPKPRIWENEYIRTAIMVILIVAVVFGFWYGSQLVLNTQYPALTVASGSMCKLYGVGCDGWSHPFEPTLHVGDLIIVQGISPERIKAAADPDGDIIVFRRLDVGDLIVHRAVGKQIKDNKTYFQTQGDGNHAPDRELVPEDHVIGKVVLRIPWVGHVALFMHNSSGIFIIVILIVILVTVEFIIPMFWGKKSGVKQGENSEKTAGA